MPTAGEGPKAVEHHLEVTRTARYWTLGAPDRDHEEVWFVLHGYKQLARRFLHRFVGLAESSRLIVAPEGLSRFYLSGERGSHGPESVVGATWMTREDREHEIRDYVAYLDRLSSALLRSGPRLTVLGFSQGVATAWRWVTYGTVRSPSRLVLWAGYLPPDLDMERAAGALVDTEVVLVRGQGDRSLTEALAVDEASSLAQAGIVCHTIAYSGGHDIDAATLERIAAL